MINNSTLIEETVRKKITGKLAVRRNIAVVCYIAVPVLACIALTYLKSFGTMLFYAPGIIIIQILIAWFTYRYFFRVEYDYSLFDNEMSVYEIHNNRSRKEICSFSVDRDTLFCRDDSPSLERLNGRIDRSYECLAGDEKEHYVLVWDDEKTTGRLDFAPSDRMVSMLSRYSRLQK